VITDHGGEVTSGSAEGLSMQVEAGLSPRTNQGAQLGKLYPQDVLGGKDSAGLAMWPSLF